MAASKHLHSSDDYLYDADIGGDLDLITLRPGYGTNSRERRPIRAFIVGTAGDVVITPPGKAAQTITVQAGVLYPLQAVAITDTGTTAAGFLFMW